VTVGVVGSVCGWRPRSWTRWRGRWGA